MPDDADIMAEEFPTLQPIGRGERIQAIDILRGFALIGVLLVNIHYFGFPMLFEDIYRDVYPSRIDQVVLLVEKVLVSGKFFSIFAFLFGLGMAVQLSRARNVGVGFVSLYVRRLLILLAIGLLHDLLLWYGLILVAYALMGFLLLAFQGRSPRLILVLAGILVFVPPVANRIYRELSEQAPVKTAESVNPGAERRQAFDETVDLFRNGSYRDMVVYRIGQLRLTVVTLLIHGWYMLAMFLLGLWSWRCRLWQRIEAHLPLLKKILSTGLVLAVAGSAAVVYFELNEPQPGFGWDFWVAGLANQLAEAALCIVYVCTIALLCRRRWWQQLLSPLAAVGRTALSNYLLQSLICTTIFYSYGFGYFGQAGPVANLVLTAAIFTIQVGLSIWWTRHFRFGPAEWLWRSLTYGKLQPIRQSHT
jgi:uncharacterized protein